MLFPGESSATAASSAVVITSRDIVFNCPRCEGELVVDREGAGLELACPHCKAPLSVPQATEDGPPPVARAEPPLPAFDFSEASKEQLDQRAEELAHQLKENGSQDIEMRGHINRTTIELHRLQLKLAKLQERKTAIVREQEALRSAIALRG